MCVCAHVIFFNQEKSESKGKPIIWCGDLNVAHQEIDLYDPDNNHFTSGFTYEERYNTL